MTDPEPQNADRVDHLFRAHYRYLVAALTAAMGPQHLQTAEDAVAEAMVRALRHWPHQGEPAQPRAWLYKVARNLCLDSLRQTATQNRHRETIASLNQTRDREPTVTDVDSLQDDELAMLFMVGHPALTPESQMALALKVVGGFSVGEIARAFLAKESAVAQRLTRARRTLAEQCVSFELPPPDQLEERLETVLNVLYLMFTEGHMAHEGDALVRADICLEALRLTEILAQHPQTASPPIAALAAMMAFTAARLPGRLHTNGDLALIQDQDRARWDRRLLTRGLRWLQRAGQGEMLTAWHVEAEIAAHHSMAPSAEAVDWSQIVTLYDTLLKLKPSPIIALNRAVALEHVAGAAVALQSLEPLKGHPKLQDYYPYHLTLGIFHGRVGERKAARTALKTALDLCKSGPVRAYLLDLLREG